MKQKQVDVVGHLGVAHSSAVLSLVLTLTCNWEYDSFIRPTVITGRNADPFPIKGLAMKSSDDDWLHTIQHLNWNRFKNRERDPGKCWDLLEDEEMKKWKRPDWSWHLQTCS